MTVTQKKRLVWFVVAFLMPLVAVVGFYLANPPAQPAPDEVASSHTEKLEAGIHYACSYCHAYPQPEIFPRGFWLDEVRQAYGFIQKSDLDPSLVPAFAEVVNYYQQRAPAEFELAPQYDLPQTSPVKFVAKPLELETPPPVQGVAFVSWDGSSVASTGGGDGLACDMRNGRVLRWNPTETSAKIEVLAEIGHPVHVVTGDLDSDGHDDLIVADIGSIMPTDQKTGRVIWLRRKSGGEEFEPIVIAEDLGRVADVQIADFDDDGDDDLVVAVFGWRENGQVLYLENQTEDYQRPQFRPVVLDPRTGAIHVPIVDLNEDGRPDFLALMSQEHEQIVAFLNQGQGEFRKELVFDASNPGYGSSGMRPADVDQDGDLDILLCNGDTMDLMIFRPQHSVQWLENEGTFPFRHHHLIQLPGAYQTAVGDLDEDGDLDIVASTFLPSGLFHREGDIHDDPLTLVQEMQVPSLIWLEQTEPGSFRKHPLESMQCYHPSVEMADFDADGDLDIVTANCTMEEFPGFRSAAKFSEIPGSLTVWENQTIAQNVPEQTD